MTMLSKVLAAVTLIITSVSPAFADEDSTPESNATNAIWKAILAVGEPENSREMLLHEFKAVVEEFPGSPHVKTAKKYASILESMIREDREHKTLTRNTKRCQGNTKRCQGEHKKVSGTVYWQMGTQKGVRNRLLANEADMVIASRWKDQNDQLRVDGFIMY